MRLGERKTNAPFSVSLTFDVEMCTNFPYWTSVWDHAKSQVDPETKRFCGKLADIAATFDVRFQWFILGESLEHPDLDYLHRLVSDGHPIGNHTYRHVNVKAKTFDQLQVRYRDDPSLASGSPSPLDTIRSEIQKTTAIMQGRLGIVPLGFRTPGGFGNGLQDALSVQQLLRDEGFRYCSAHYEYSAPRDASWEQLCDALRRSVIKLQPYHYESGLLEIPMMGISDIGAFRGLDLERDRWIALLENGVDVASEHGWVYSILMHPQVIACRDPKADTIRRVIDRTLRYGGRLVTNDGEAAQRWRGPT